MFSLFCMVFRSMPGLPLVSSTDRFVCVRKFFEQDASFRYFRFPGHWKRSLQSEVMYPLNFKIVSSWWPLKWNEYLGLAVDLPTWLCRRLVAEPYAWQKRDIGAQLFGSRALVYERSGGLLMLERCETFSRRNYSQSRAIRIPLQNKETALQNSGYMRHSCGVYSAQKSPLLLRSACIIWISQRLPSSLYNENDHACHPGCA